MALNARPYTAILPNYAAPLQVVKNLFTPYKHKKIRNLSHNFDQHTTSKHMRNSSKYFFTPID